MRRVVAILAAGLLGCIEQVPVEVEGNARVYYETTQVCTLDVQVAGSCAGYSTEDIVAGTWTMCREDGKITIVVTSSAADR